MADSSSTIQEVGNRTKESIFRYTPPLVAPNRNTGVPKNEFYKQCEERYPIYSTKNVLSKDISV